MNHEQEIEVLKRQVKSLRILSRDLSQFMDCLTSPLWKRIWWWFGGYYFRQVGRWYSRDSLTFKVWFALARLIRCT